MAKVTTIPFSELQRLARLTDEAAMWLIRNNKLPLALVNKELHVTVDQLSESSLVEAFLCASSETCPTKDPVLEERIGTLITSELNSIMEEAFALLVKNGKIRAA